MSFEAMAWAVKQRGVGSSSKLVLMILANHSNGHTGQCNPKIKNIATECEMCDSTVKANIKKLQDVGLIRIENKFYDGVQLPNQYWLNIHDENWGGGSKSDPGVGQNLATYIVDRNSNKEPQVADATVREFPCIEIHNTDVAECVQMRVGLDIGVESDIAVVSDQKKSNNKKKKVYSKDSEEYITAKYLESSIRSWSPTYALQPEAFLQTWCNDFNELFVKHGVSHVKQRCFIAAITEDDYVGKNGFTYKKNTKSGFKFRVNYITGEYDGLASRAKEIYEENFK
jgi:hypothetical protein